MRFVIIGAGPAGVTAAETIREHDPQARITMLSAEPHPPYSPPAMADHFLTGREESLFWKGRDFAERLGLDFRAAAPVAAVRTEAREVVLEDGTELPWDRLIIASGAALHAPVEGHHLRGVYNFKSLQAATELIERARSGKAKTVLIVGAGFIGIEVALLLADLGLGVTLLEMADQVMPRVLDEETAEIVLQQVRARGVVVHLNTRCMAFKGRRKVKGVVLLNGGTVKADVYVAATGVKPNIAFLFGSGIRTGWGIVVDERLRTDAADVWAAGDVAETIDRMTGYRYVHAIFPNAVAQGRIAALGALGYDAVYEGAESMNSLKHLGLSVVAVGSADGGQELRWRHLDTLRKVFLHDGRIIGFRLVGDIRGAGLYRALMLKGVDVSGYGDGLLDPRFSMAEVALPAMQLAG